MSLYLVTAVIAPFGVAHDKIGTIQRTWPLHKDDTLFRSGRPTGLNIYQLLTGRRFRKGGSYEV
ncbi:hypothetical protein PAXINDRAFT_91837 [Paxillus involutus ATCC 200175]|uniref:Uncharacterized protein n=1 Tax=Paxillus involutus ATCC 200175 TaxID=664439 RepID=A0A0C9TEG3_PAXIN|nr:hypothetical protein PAXINDRAFT_91837 [Paxillus involutus ATCC 200175]